MFWLMLSSHHVLSVSGEASGVGLKRADGEPLLD